MDLICLAVTFKMAFDSLLSVATAFGGCGWSISAREVRMDVAFWKFSINPPNYAAVADAMTFIIILNYTCRCKFYGVIEVIGVLFLGLGTIEKYPPALLHASGSER